MLSLLRLQANRRNALKSTGPRTMDGKSASRLNAVRHGINSSIPVLARGESKAKWHKFARTVIADLQPVGPLEAFWAGRVALLQWQLARCTAARQTLANQRYREAIVTAPQSAWWQFRQGQENRIPISLDQLRKHMRDNKRLQTLLVRVVANSDDAARVEPAAAIELITWAATHLRVEDHLEEPLADNRFPGIGSLDNDPEIEGYEWNLSQLREGLSEVAAWADTTFDSLAASLPPALKEAFILMRRTARRGEYELRRYRHCADAHATEKSEKFDKYETDLERRICQALDQLRLIQFQRGANAMISGANVDQNSVQVGFVSLQAPDKPREIGFVPTEQAPNAPDNPILTP